MSKRTPSGRGKNANMAAAASVLPLALSMLPISNHVTGSSTAFAQSAMVATADFDGCPVEGTGNDPDLNTQKNRSAAALNPQPITAERMINGLTNPKGKPPATSRSSDKWTGPIVQQVENFEAEPVVLTAYVVKAKAEGKEACNCNSPKAADHDVHVYVNDDADDDSPADAAIVEVTPRWRDANPAWTATNINALSGRRVRFTGWLLFDQFHFSMIGEGQRATLWEIHPITAIQVETDSGSWEDLSQYEDDQGASDNS
jgi:hypothetical protein